MVTLDVVGQLLTLSEREAEELRRAAAADAGRSSARRDLSLLLDGGLRTHVTVVLNRAEARELAELLDAGGFRARGFRARDGNAAGCPPWRKCLQTRPSCSRAL